VNKIILNHGSSIPRLCYFSSASTLKLPWCLNNTYIVILIQYLANNITAKGAAWHRAELPSKRYF
jgi:hypothetical protein